jgi:hypothetical protein
MKTITVTESRVINCSADEVRAQFSDMEYHADTKVHQDLTFVVHSQSPDRKTALYRSEIKILWMTRVEENRNRILDNGELVTENMSGEKPILKLKFIFREVEKEKTDVIATFSEQVSGFHALLAPFLRNAIRKAIIKGLDEDKRDIEAGNHKKWRSRHKPNHAKKSIA